MSAAERLAWADCESHHMHDDLSELTRTLARPCDASRSSAAACLAADADLAADIELGQAWREAEAALPEGWGIEVGRRPGLCWAEAWRFDGGVLAGSYRVDAESGSPAEALRTLAQKLREAAAAGAR